MFSFWKLNRRIPNKLAVYGGKPTLSIKRNTATLSYLYNVTVEGGSQKAGVDNVAVQLRAFPLPKMSLKVPKNNSLQLFKDGFKVNL